jgi:hypothetical protein
MLQPKLSSDSSNEKASFAKPGWLIWGEAPVGEWLERLDKLGEDANWQGAGADAFWQYIAGVGTAADEQHDLAALLTAILHAHSEILSRCYRDVWKIGEDTINVLASIYDCNPQTVSEELTVVGAVLAVAAEFESAGTATPGIIATAEAVGVVSGLLGMAGSSSSNSTIGGGSIDEVLTSMREALRKEASLVEEERRQLLEILHGASGIVHSESRSDSIRPEHPSDLLKLKHAKRRRLKSINGFYQG